MFFVVAHFVAFVDISLLLLIKEFVSSVFVCISIGVFNVEPYVCGRETPRCIA